MNAIKNPYLVCLAASLFSFYDLFQLSICNVISIPLLSEFKLNSFILGLFSSSFLITNALGLILLGLLLDRYSTRIIGLLFMGLTALCTIGFGISNSINFDIVFRSLQGLASAASLLICIRTNTQWFKQNRNFALNASLAIALCGGVLGNALFARMVFHFGWRHSLIIVGLAGIIIFYLLYLWLYDTRDVEHSYPRDNSLTMLASLIKAFSEIKNTFAGLYLGLMSTPIFILGTLWGNYLLIKTYHASPPQAGFYSSFLFVGMILGAPLWGRLSDKFISADKLLYLGCLLVIACAFSLFSGKLSMFGAGLIFLAIGFFSIVQNLLYIFVNTINKEPILSTATAVTAVLLNLVGAITQLLFSKLLLVASINSAGFILFLPAFSICLLLVFFITGKNHIKYAEVIK